METINTYYEDFTNLRKFVGDNHEVLFNGSNSAVLVQIFSGICDKNHIFTISGQIRDLIPGAQVIGSTTNGEIMNGLVSSLKTVISFTAFRHSSIKVALFEKKNENDYELGQAIAATLNRDLAKLLIMFSTGPTVNATQLLKGVQSVNDSLPVAGGNAGDNRTNTSCFVCCNGDVTDCGVVGVTLEGEELTVICHNHLGWQPIGKEMTVTRSEGPRIYTIDHIPAFQVYCQYLGIDTTSDIINGSEFPLIVYKHDLEIARSPHFRYDDDSVNFFGDVDEGDKVRFSFGHVEMILEKIDSLLQIIEQQPVESIFVYSCGGRRFFFQNSAQIETLPLQNIAPTSGFFTSGEFFHANNSNHLLNSTMTTVALSESSRNNETFTPEPRAAACTKEDCDAMVVNDNYAYKSLDVLKVLTHLIKQSEAEIGYLSYHDKLTGLYNRTYFEEELKRINTKRQLPLGLIIGDVNGLKLINDALGHFEGDKVLKEAAEIFRKSCRQEDVISRWGGDEFIVLLPRCDSETTLKIFKRIKDSFIKINSLPIPINISLGMAIRNNLDQDIKDVIREAEEKMYRNKLLESRSNRSTFIKTLEKTLWERSHETEQHCRRIQKMTQRIGRVLKLSSSELDNLKLLAALHDIGKIAIPNDILDKPGKLSPEEWATVKNHPEIGYRIVISSPELAPIAEAILHHHEWWDGSGYPLGLKGERIPIISRIIAIADAYDVMINGRPYKKPMSESEAWAEIERCAGTQFDPKLVEKVLLFEIKGL
ncbi:MAG: HD domain-containing phosphohydrolase [Syntrophomonas sp.]